MNLNRTLIGSISVLSIHLGISQALNQVASEVWYDKSIHNI